MGIYLDKNQNMLIIFFIFVWYLHTFVKYLIFMHLWIFYYDGKKIRKPLFRIGNLANVSIGTIG